jgi:hypothetical protein
MISKIFLTGQSFGQTCRYVCQDLVRAEVLAVDGVRGYDHRLMAEDFELQHRFNPVKEKPVFHGMLSFLPGEDPGNALMVEIAQLYLQKIKMSNTQYAIVKHIDKGHLHMHILANRVNNNGEIIGKGLIIERGIKAARELTLEYRLRQEQGKNLDLTHRAALHEPDAKRYRLYEAIYHVLPGCRQIEDLEKGLLLRGITTRYRQDPVTGQRQGISFRIEKMAFGGKQVDPAYSLQNLERTILQQKQEEELRVEQERRAQVLGHRQGFGHWGGEGHGSDPDMQRELSRREALNEEEELTHRHRISHDYGLGL